MHTTLGSVKGCQLSAAPCCTRLKWALGELLKACFSPSFRSNFDCSSPAALQVSSPNVGPLIVRLKEDFVNKNRPPTGLH